MPRDGQATPCEWFSAAELAALALPGMPATKGKVLELAKRQDWQRPAWEGTHWRQRAGRGGGVEYHLAVLPMVARAKLAFAEHQAAQEPVTSAAEGLWDWYARQPTTKKAKAEARLKALDAVETLVRAGERRVQAMQMIAAEQKVALSSLYEWAKLTHGLAREDWLPALAPRHAGGRESADLPAEAWAMLKGAFLRPEGPPRFTDCYRHVTKAAKTEGWTIPSERTLRRRMDMEVSPAAQTLMRYGVDAMRRMFPAQQRDRGVFHAMEAVNADGHTWDVFVKWPDGSIGRPHMVAFQDLYSGKILSFRVDVSLSWHTVRLAFGDMVETFGIPRLCWLDNGREFAAKHITGGQKTRYRFKVKDEEPEGLMTTMGVEVHWTTPYHGQAKPIERAFRDFAQSIATHPAFAGAYTGNSPTTKPHNYGSKAVPLDTFMRVISEEIAEHNARKGRRSPICAGRSFDETFEASYVVSPIKKPSLEQRLMWMLAAEAVKPRAQDGAIHLHGNRYWADFLLPQRGSHVVARFDPDALHEPLHIYAADGRYLGEAPCLQAAGFNSVADAAAYGRDWKQYLRGKRQEVEALNRMSIAEVARKLPQIEAAEPPEARVVQMVFPRQGNAALAARPREEEEDANEAKLLDALPWRGPRAVPLDDEE